MEARLPTEHDNTITGDLFGFNLHSCIAINRSVPHKYWTSSSSDRITNLCSLYATSVPFSITTNLPSKVKHSPYPRNILPSFQLSLQLTVSNKIRGRRSSGLKLIFLVSRLRAIDSFLADDEGSRIPRIIATSSSLPHCAAPVVPSRAGTSLLVSFRGRESSTGDLPGLSSGGSLTPPESISSSLGAYELSRCSRVLSQDVPGGPLVLPPPVEEPIFECPFNFLQCDRAFRDQREWFKHSLTHFKDVGPPTSNECPFCDQHGRFTIAEPRMESWTLRMECVSSHHKRGQRVATARPDFRLINYLWENSLMDIAQYRNLRCRSESQTTPYTVTESRRSRRRQR